MNQTPQLRNSSLSRSPLVGGSCKDKCASEAVASTTFGMTRATPSEIKPNNQIVEMSGNQIGRIAALDFTKGALVLVMVLYHWLNYFAGPQGSFYRYLSFLPPSFICITGFLISHVYLSKYRITDARLPRRLLVRGLKILGIFILLNAAISLLIPKSYHGRRFFESFSVDTLQSIFVTGNMTSGRVVAFYVLVPIGYLLLLSAGLLIACRYYKHIFHVMTALGLLLILILDLNGSKSGSLELLTIGLLGISIGYIPIGKINHILRHPFTVILAYLCYTAAITVWNIPYPLQVAGVLLTLVVIYMLGTAGGERGRMQGTLIMLGKYSLFAYIAQIAILQTLRRGLPVNLSVGALGASFFAAIALTIICVKALDLARAKAAVVNRMYAVVFS
jgi:peptidoglycan/LPS O-acetylase OafA/YrhL